MDTERMARIRAEATEKLDAMREQIAELNEQLQIDVDDFDLPDIEIPEANVTLGTSRLISRSLRASNTGVVVRPLQGRFLF